jgi:hypothetical protein
MKVQFQYIQPEKVRSVWSTIKPGLETTARKAPGGWLVEDVYRSLLNNTSTLHLGIVENRYRGFVITQMVESPECRKLLIWILYGESVSGMFADNFDQFREWAANIGAAKIQFQSPRKGWEKVAGALGFEPVQVIYESDI